MILKYYYCSFSCCNFVREEWRANGIEKVLNIEYDDDDEMDMCVHFYIPTEQATRGESRVKYKKKEENKENSVSFCKARVCVYYNEIKKKKSVLCVE